MNDPGRYDIVLHRGATFRHSFVYKDRDGSIRDLTNLKAVLTVLESTLSPKILLKLTSDVDGGILLGGTTGQVDLHISAEQVGIQNWYRGIYYLSLIDSFKEITPLLEGRFTISEGNFQ